jgi:hypothetical protein
VVLSRVGRLLTFLFDICVDGVCKILFVCVVCFVSRTVLSTCIARKRDDIGEEEEKEMNFRQEENG